MSTKPAELSDIVAAVRRHWILVVFIAILGLGIGLLATFAIPVKYTSTASVSVKPMTADPLSTSSDSTKAVNMATEEQLARSRRVAEAAVERLSPQRDLDVQTMIDNTTVETPQDSLVLNITHRGSTAALSADVANAVAESYLAVRRGDATEQIELLEKRTQDQIDRLKPLKANPGADGCFRPLATTAGGPGRCPGQHARRDRPHRCQPRSVRQSRRRAESPVDPGLPAIGDRRPLPRAASSPFRWP